MEKLISIAMCTYNGERFIAEQLESILNQTYKNIEIVITDDCSNDKTVEIITNYMNHDKRIKFYQNETNLGFVKNFEKAITYCSGDYIALADQDDLWKLTKLEEFEKKINNNVLIYSDATIIDENSNEIGLELIRPDKCLIRGKCNKALFLTNCISGNAMMFKQELVKYILPIPQKISYHDIWIGFVASTYGTIDYTNESMIYYRRYSEQVTHVQKAQHNSFIERLSYKQDRFLKLSDERATDLEVFRSLKILNDAETIELLDLLIKHFRNIQDSYFNRELYKKFRTDMNNIFACFPKKKQAKKAFRTAVGLKLRTLTLFKL